MSIGEVAKRGARLAVMKLVSAEANTSLLAVREFSANLRKMVSILFLARCGPHKNHRKRKAKMNPPIMIKRLRDALNHFFPIFLHSTALSFTVSETHRAFGLGALFSPLRARPRS